MKKIICYLRTLKEIETVLKVWMEFGALYIAHDFVEQKSYIRGKKIYEPLKCKTCGYISVAWREYK